MTTGKALTKPYGTTNGVYYLKVIMERNKAKENLEIFGTHQVQKTQVQIKRLFR